MQALKMVRFDACTSVSPIFSNLNNITTIAFLEEDILFKIKYLSGRKMQALKLNEDLFKELKREIFIEDSQVVSRLSVVNGVCQ